MNLPHEGHVANPSKRTFLEHTHTPFTYLKKYLVSTHFCKVISYTICKYEDELATLLPSHEMIHKLLEKRKF